MTARKSPAKTATKRRAPKYSCENPRPSGPYAFKEAIKKMMKDSDFAEFIHDLLCRWSDMRPGSAEAKEAQACLEKWIAPPARNSADLDDLCFPPSTNLKAFGGCTDITTLIGMAAWVTTGATTRRKRKSGARAQ